MFLQTRCNFTQFTCGSRDQRTWRGRAVHSADGVLREESAQHHGNCSRMLADLLGVMRLRRHNREPFYSLEVAVAADENSAQGEGGGSHPEVVLIKGQAPALLRHFDISVHITRGWWNRLTR